VQSSFILLKKKKKMQQDASQATRTRNTRKKHTAQHVLVLLVWLLMKSKRGDGWCSSGLASFRGTIFGIVTSEKKRTKVHDSSLEI
jgi:hypothetical protein